MIKPLRILAATLLFITSTGWASDDIGQDEAQALRNQGNILPLEKILDAARHLHPGRVAEVELKQKRNRYIYEVEIVDAKGKVWEMKIDASDASLISQEQDD